MMKMLPLAQINSVRITIITRPADSYKLTDQPGMIALIQTLSDSGIRIVTKPNIHQKFAVIDQNVVWYGSINLMSYGSAEESIMRFENMEIAGELLTAVE
jgi:phosphatidylserine/phosphatidylglycerophosphate/cardiolipin synthase-like enzyme